MQSPPSQPPVSWYLHNSKTRVWNCSRAKKRSTKSLFSASTPHSRTQMTLTVSHCLEDALPCSVTRRVWTAPTDSTISLTTTASGCSRMFSCSLVKAFYLKTLCSTSRWRAITPRRDLPRLADTRVVFSSNSLRSLTVKLHVKS